MVHRLALCDLMTPPAALSAIELGLIGRNVRSKAVGLMKGIKTPRCMGVNGDQRSDSTHVCTQGHQRELHRRQDHSHSVGLNVHAHRPSHSSHHYTIIYNNVKHCPSIPICSVRASAPNIANYYQPSLHFTWPKNGRNLSESSAIKCGKWLVEPKTNP